MTLKGLWHLVTSAMNSWHEGKLFIEHSVSINHDALHVIVGVLVWLIMGAVTRRPLSALRPWLWLLAIIGWNETVDLWVEQWPDAGMQYGEGAKDLVLTMFLPTVLLLALRFWPSLFRGRGKGHGGRR
jgi:hypothetical protein